MQAQEHDISPSSKYYKNLNRKPKKQSAQKEKQKEKEKKEKETEKEQLDKAAEHS